jgi:hypothetical protein
MYPRGADTSFSEGTVRITSFYRTFWPREQPILQSMGDVDDPHHGGARETWGGGAMAGRRGDARHPCIVSAAHPKGARMPRDFFPRPEGQAVAFTSNFSHLINADPHLYHITPQRAADYAALQLSYAQAYQIAGNPKTATEGAVSGRRAARKLVEAETRLIAGIVRAAPDITAQQKLDLGLKVRRPPRRRPRPNVAPRVCVSATVGQMLTIDLFDNEAGKRRIPRGAKGADIFWYAGDLPPAKREAWKFAKATTRARAVVELPVVLPPGTKVWLQAWWRNNRGPGPSCNPICTYLGYAAPKLPAIPKAA